MIRKPILLLIYFIILCGCKSTFLPKQPVGFNIAPDIKNFVIIDAGITYTPGIAIKKKRDEVIKEVRDQYLLMLSTTLQKQLQLTNIVDTTLTSEEKNKLLQKDSSAIAAIRDRHKSAIILMLKDCSSGFRQGDIYKEPGSNRNSTFKKADYNVFFDTDWIIINSNSINERAVTASRYHSTRTIVSGLLARGPGFEANKKDILTMAEQNAFNVAMLFKY